MSIIVFNKSCAKPDGSPSGNWNLSAKLGSLLSSVSPGWLSLVYKTDKVKFVNLQTSQPAGVYKT